MDDYVSKPIQIENLIAGPESNCRPAAASSASNPESRPGRAGTASCVFSRDAALLKMGGDEELLREVVAAFLEACEATVSAVEVACRRAIPRRCGGPLTPERLVATFSTGPLYETALELEQCGRDEYMQTVQQSYRRLRGEPNNCCRTSRVVRAVRDQLNRTPAKQHVSSPPSRDNGADSPLILIADDRQGDTRPAEARDGARGIQGRRGGDGSRGGASVRVRFSGPDPARLHHAELDGVDACARIRTWSATKRPRS